ncbi:HEAT repeat domain-containing protein [Kitasatospora sp. NBC_00315]|uniref:HEAT repeat domain-containing protein n=1 Tax=Kitasatospora sp. NBC_00315 TaxID=2975963 RepID=UPI0032467E9E
METGTAAELVDRALALARATSAQDTDATGPDDEYRALLWRAAGLDGPGAVTIGLALTGSEDIRDRAAGCDLLGRASDRHEPLRARVVAALAELAERETEPYVLCSLAEAIERTYHQHAVPVLVALAGHPDADVRRYAAGSFAGVLTGRSDGPDIRSLIALTRDQDPEVRDLATFTLGFQADADSPAIRAALRARVADAHPEVREEGIRGLARRHDPRAVPLLAGLLADPAGARLLTFRAAQIMGAPELLPALREYEPGSPGVSEALNACDPQWRARLDSAAWELVCAVDVLRPDLAAGLSMERFEAGLSLGIGPCGEGGYSVEALLRRAAGDPGRAAALVARDHPAGAGPDVGPGEDPDVGPGEEPDVGPGEDSGTARGAAAPGPPGQDCASSAKWAST